MIRFANPQMFWLLLVPLCVYYILPAVKQMYGDALKVPFVGELAEIENQTKLKDKLRAQIKVPYFRILLLTIIWGLLLAALARPQWAGEPMRIKNEGRDILLVVDISNSMQERDFAYQGRYYDRLSAVKHVVSQFVDKRTEDKIGLVLFGTRAYLQVPLTYDKQSLKDVLAATDAGMAGNSTSIGDAVGVALKNMPIEDKSSKIIILLTDGENNDGSISMPQAVELAADENVKIYTVGVGNDEVSFWGGLFSMPRDSGLDEAGLKKLAQTTAGTYFRAKDVSSLQKIYEQIDKLEPQTQEGRYVQETKDLFYIPTIAALLLFMLLIMIMRKAG